MSWGEVNLMRGRGLFDVYTLQLPDRNISSITKNVLLRYLEHLIRIQGTQGSDLGLEADYPD
jgi:hypothetical protein